MSSNEVFQPSTINLFFRGLMVMFTNNPKECKVGLLRNAPNHNHQIIVQEKATGASGFSEIARFTDDAAAGSFNLDVQNVKQPGIRKRGESEQIDRFEGADSDSVNWVLDCEKEFFPKPIGARDDGFVSFLTLNNGEIFTSLVSPNHLQFQRPKTKEWIHFGRVAVEMGVEVKLDQEGSTASFTKVGQPNPIFNTKPATAYQIIVERAEANAQDATGRDANLYFQAIGTQPIPEDQQIKFRSFPRLDELDLSLAAPNTPDAACPLNQQSQSGLS